MNKQTRKSFIVTLSRSFVTVDLDCSNLNTLSEQLIEAATKAVELVTGKIKENDFIQITNFEEQTVKFIKENSNKPINDQEDTDYFKENIAEELIEGVGRIICIATHNSDGVEEYFIDGERILQNAGIALK